MGEPWLSILGGGAVAAVVTLIFNSWWDSRKQKLSEDWEFRRYQANMIHAATVGIVEAFYASKVDFNFMVATLGTLLASLNQLTQQADAIVRQQGGTGLTVAEFENRKAQLLQPFRTFNNEQVTLRWNQYEQRGKDRHAKAESHLSALEPLIVPTLHAELMALYTKLSQPFSWSLEGAQEKLLLFEAELPELNRLRGQLARQIEIKLGRREE